jgi:hypothetical protein
MVNVKLTIDELRAVQVALILFKDHELASNLGKRTATVVINKVDEAIKEEEEKERR